MGGVGEDRVRRQRPGLHQVERRWRMGIADREVFLGERKKPRWPSAWALRKAMSSSSARIDGRPPAKCSGRVRLRCAELLGLTKGSEALNFLWVVDFPLLAFVPEENKWVAVHHPFTRPKAEDMALLESGRICAKSAPWLTTWCSMAWNSAAARSGFTRSDLQARLFEVLGVGPEEQQQKFGHLLRAFSFGAPPHGGMALGLDRLVMLIAGAESIREVIAFPKNNRGVDLMTQLAGGGRFQAAARSLYPEHGEENAAAGLAGARHSDRRESDGPSLCCSPALSPTPWPAPLLLGRRDHSRSVRTRCAKSSRLLA